MNAPITVWPSVHRPDQGRRFPLAALLRRVREPIEYPTKEAVWRVSAGTYRGDYRNRASFLSEAFVVTDLGDHGPAASSTDVRRVFSGLLGFAHSTWSSTPAAPRFRMWLRLSRSIDADEHDRVIRAVHERVEQAGFAPDVSSKGAPHAWAVPAKRPGYEHVELIGAPLDVAAALARFPKPVQLPATDRSRPGDSRDRLLDRARRYVAATPGAIQGANGSAATFKLALALVRGFGLGPDDALQLLVEYNERCVPPWTERELRHKVRQAMQRGRMPVGFLADRTVRP